MDQIMINRIQARIPVKWISHVAKSKQRKAGQGPGNEAS